MLLLAPARAMRAWPFALVALAIVPTALAQAPDVGVVPAAEEDDPLESTALRAEAPVSPTLAGANGALLFGAMGAAFGAVVALGRYHKRRLRPIELGVLREKKG